MGDHQQFFENYIIKNKGQRPEDKDNVYKLASAVMEYSPALNKMLKESSSTQVDLNIKNLDEKQIQFKLDSFDFLQADDLSVLKNKTITLPNNIYQQFLKPVSAPQPISGASIQFTGDDVFKFLWRTYIIAIVYLLEKEQKELADKTSGEELQRERAENSKILREIFDTLKALVSTS